jgi:hypothetical protein
MRIVFTKGKNPISWAIRKLTKEPVSHVAFVFDEKLVIHMNMSGFHVDWLKDFLSKAQVIASIEKNLTLTKEEAVYQQLIKLDGSKYDFGAILYAAWRFFLHRAFKKPLPTENKWAAKSKLWCLELLDGPIRQHLGVPKDVKLDAITPWQLYKILGGEK